MNLPNGTPVLVSDPKHTDSTHEHEFSGVVVNSSFDQYTVEDQNGDCFDVSADEVTPLEL